LVELNKHGRVAFRYDLDKRQDSQGRKTEQLRPVVLSACAGMMVSSSRHTINLALISITDLLL